MPNWNYNKLTISKADFKRCILKDGEPTYTKLLPTPSSLNIVAPTKLTDASAKAIEAVAQSIDEHDKNYLDRFIDSVRAKLPDMTTSAIIAYWNKQYIGYTDWYDWCNETWGVKWDMTECQIEDKLDELEDDDCVTFRFVSPWGPPNLWFRYLIEEAKAAASLIFYNESITYDFGYLTGADGEYRAYFAPSCKTNKDRVEFLRAYEIDPSEPVEDVVEGILWDEPTDEDMKVWSEALRTYDDVVDELLY